MINPTIEAQRPTATGRVCKFCKHPISDDMVYGHAIVCRHCHQVEDLPVRRSWRERLLAPAILLGVVLLTFAIFRNEVLLFVDPALAVRGLSEDKVLALKDQCLFRRDEPCALAAYERLHEIAPDNAIYAANFAFRLTDLRRFDEAALLYQQILKSGTGTYDLMAYYGMTLDAQGKTLEAIKWYEKALEIHPDLVDITRKLAALYVKDGRVLTSISLLRSFAKRLPKSQGYIVGDLSANLELIGKEKFQAEENQIVHLKGVNGHFALPITLQENASPLVFLVDTGASIVTIPTSDAETYFRDRMKDAAPGISVLADGRTIKSYRMRVPSLQMGPWEFKNVLVAYCDNCERLIGMSLLRDMKMEISSKGDLYTMTLRR